MLVCGVNHTPSVSSSSSHTHTHMHTHTRIHTHTHTHTPHLLPTSSPQSQEHMFTWDMISNYEADLEEQAFTFQYNREGRGPRWVKVFSPFVSPHVDLSHQTRSVVGGRKTECKALVPFIASGHIQPDIPTHRDRPDFFPALVVSCFSI